MLRLSPTDWRTQVKIFEKFGCLYVRQKGTHLIYHHPDAKIPQPYPVRLGKRTIAVNLRKAIAVPGSPVGTVG